MIHLKPFCQWAGIVSHTFGSFTDELSLSFLNLSSDLRMPIECAGVEMRIAIMALLIISLCGCAMSEKRKEELRAQRERRAQAEYDLDHQYDGWTEDQIIGELGAPGKIETAGSFKIYYYQDDHGSTAKSSGGTSLIGGNAFSSSSSKIRNHFELTTIFFKDGKVDHWDNVRQ